MEGGRGERQEERMEAKITETGATKPRGEKTEEKEEVGAGVEVEGRVAVGVHELGTLCV